MKELRLTASEIELKRLFYKLNHNDNMQAERLLGEVKRQMYFDGAEDMLQSIHGKTSKVERTNVIATLEQGKRD
jgi:hypothetical protein